MPSGGSSKWMILGVRKNLGESVVFCYSLTLQRPQVFFDIQGIQYSGKLLPGPSMLLLSQHGSNLRLEGVTDDFVQATCTKSRKGIDVGMSSTFARCDEDVNTTREVIAEIKAKNMK